jgi:hypothetical protein
MGPRQNHWAPYEHVHGKVNDHNAMEMTSSQADGTDTVETIANWQQCQCSFHSIARRTGGSATFGYATISRVAACGPPHCTVRSGRGMPRTHKLKSSMLMMHGKLIYGFVRIISVGGNHYRNDQLCRRAWEIFGSLIK